MRLTTKELFPQSKLFFWRKIIPMAPVFIFLSFVFSVWTLGIYFETKGENDWYSHRTGILIFFWIFYLLFLFYLPFILAIKRYLKKYFYSITDAGLLIQKQQFSLFEIYIPLSSIQSIIIGQNFWDKIFKVYNIGIFTPSNPKLGNGYTLEGFDLAIAKSLMGHLTELASSASPNKILTQTAETKADYQDLKIGVGKAFTGDVSSLKYPLSNKIFTFTAFSILKFAIGLYVLFFIMAIIIGALMKAFVVKGFDVRLFVYIIFGLTTIGVLWKTYAQILAKNKFYFEMKADGIYFRMGSLGVSEVTIPYRIIQEVTLSQTNLQYLLKIASVIIKTSKLYETQIGDYISSDMIAIPSLKYSDAQTVAQSLRDIINK